MRNFNYYLPLRGRGKNLKAFYGTLTASDWNENEEPIEFSLFTLDEADILLGSPHLKKKYIKLLNRPVEVIGEKKINSFGDEYICVQKIRRLNYPDFQFLSNNLAASNPCYFQEYTPMIAKNYLENLETKYMKATS